MPHGNARCRATLHAASRWLAALQHRLLAAGAGIREAMCARAMRPHRRMVFWNLRSNTDACDRAACHALITSPAACNTRVIATVDVACWQQAFPHSLFQAGTSPCVQHFTQPS
ncbi:hypothetical protein XvhCFBP2543_17005 [Xanthomonas vasicola]|uniref:Uncharacterized protein n=1 Tax=Xanthomonas vasicola TaxID=56459 RepID=A0ABD7S6X8_XANVA|nr:hypothetical protein XvhCFBP2543_17005 [Xanthomonas vasicola]TWQ30032.1 hypothetical protein FQJ97_22895 [Xanthomonas vasicola]TWQ50312.1 hypothetical protein FQK01_18925 [Xanthomonas vasicola]TWQ54727.1 hypothetical protein FQJ94_11955 [Xanthomonas vasicola]TWQ63000.1 hypothetical protein FQJ90_15355 [Xanthomonas vasicola]